jgi:hypothetical protein
MRFRDYFDECRGTLLLLRRRQAQGNVPIDVEVGGQALPTLSR